MRHAACRCDALDISSLLTDAAAAVVDDSFLRQATCESSSGRQQQHHHGLCCSCPVEVLQSRAILHLGACCRRVRHGGVKSVLGGCRAQTVLELLLHHEGCCDARVICVCWLAAGTAKGPWAYACAAAWWLSKHSSLAALLQVLPVRLI